MRNLLFLSIIFLVGCSNFQVIDKYGDFTIERYYFENGCYNMQIDYLNEQGYVSECFERGLPQSYITGFTLGIVDLSAAQYKFENALLAYIKEKNGLDNCKVYRSNNVEMMGDTQGVEVFYQCED